jgi:uncharacterized protein with HEPN domain
MSKALLEFDLFEDREDFIHAVKGKDAFLALFDIANNIRNILKYESEMDMDRFERFRQEFFETLNTYSIDLDRDLS